jgi:ABC-type glycerol-3-phosphate transport system permease component
VTIIAILNIIGGIIMLLIGLGLAIAGAIIPFVPQSEFQQQQQNLTTDDIDLSQVPPSFLGGGILAIGGILIAIGILSFVVAYGLLKGRRWAWTLTVILSIISIVLSAISIAAGSVPSIISIIISGIILYYLYRPHVKAYFGKTVSASGASSTDRA